MRFLGPRYLCFLRVARLLYNVILRGTLVWKGIVQGIIGKVQSICFSSLLFSYSNCHVFHFAPRVENFNV